MPVRVQVPPGVHERGIDYYSQSLFHFYMNFVFPLETITQREVRSKATSNIFINIHFDSSTYAKIAIKGVTVIHSLRN